MKKKNKELLVIDEVVQEELPKEEAQEETSEVLEESFEKEQQETYTKKFKCSLHTDGSGLWSDKKKSVKVVSLELDVTTEEDQSLPVKFWGELRVFFDATSWPVDTLGLVYTDKLFLKELQEKLVEKKVCSKKASKDVSYSEQGMQGSDYVSCDVGEEFIKSFRKLNKS